MGELGSGGVREWGNGGVREWGVGELLGNDQPTPLPIQNSELRISEFPIPLTSITLIISITSITPVTSIPQRLLRLQHV